MYVLIIIAIVSISLTIRIFDEIEIIANQR